MFVSLPPAGLREASAARASRSFGKRVWSDDELVRVRELYEAGVARAEIGERLGVSADQVSRKLRRLGVCGSRAG